MMRSSLCCLFTAVVLCLYILISIPSFAMPQSANDTASPLASTNDREPVPGSAGQQALAQVGNPFDKFVETGEPAGLESPNTLGAAPSAMPAERPNPPSVSVTHFEIEGFAQWRNILTSGSVSTSNGGNISLRNDLGVGDLVAGPLIRGIWTPEFEILGATSKFWVEYGQINRSRTRNISTTLMFAGRIYVIDSNLQTELKTKQFQLGYAPRWGNDKFRIGPSFAYERLNFDFSLTDLTPGAPPPTTREVSAPNNVFLVGVDFDYLPVDRVDVYGRLGVVPCCGGGWHVLESEFGTKYFFARNISIMGGVRYSYLRRDFDLPATAIGNTTIGPFSGSIKFPGVGPFVGASWRF